MKTKITEMLGIEYPIIPIASVATTTLVLPLVKSCIWRRRISAARPRLPMNSITKAGTISRTAPPKRRKKQPPAPAGRQIPEALTPAPAHPKILPAMIAAIPTEAPAATAIPEAPVRPKKPLLLPETKSRMLQRRTPNRNQAAATARGL